MGGTKAKAPSPASDVDRIMAKIEHDNRVLAELDKSRAASKSMCCVMPGFLSTLSPPRPAYNKLYIFHICIYKCSISLSLSVYFFALLGGLFSGSLVSVCLLYALLALLCPSGGVSLSVV